MSTLDDWRVMLAEVDAADGPSREIDRRVAELCPVTGMEEVRAALRGPANVSGSLDAITALVEREMPGWKRSITTERHASFPDFAAHAAIMDRDWPDPMAGHGSWFDGHAATEPLALLAAFIRARIAELEQKERAA